jgi:hypothetical protein
MEKKKVFGNLKRNKKMKKIALIFMMIMLNNVYAAEIYVEQSGSSSTIDINQEGVGNVIGDSLNPMYLGGGSNTVNIDQIGDNNNLQAIVNGSGTNTTVTTNGSGNIQSINCGTTTSAGCSSSVIKQVVTGSDNTVTQDLGTGANHNSEITISGSDNAVTHTSTNSGASTVDVSVNGNTNTIGVTQSGLTAKTISVTSTGNSNNITINQSE